jgi:capsular polysaccharide transport system permease protein
MALEKIQRLSVKPLGSGASRGIIERLKRVNRLFLVTVIVPTIAATGYYGLVASDVYVSESRFVVRSPQKGNQSSGIFGTLLQGTGLSGSEENAYAVIDYMTSRDALSALNKGNTFSDAYGNGHGDLVSRFGALGLQTTFEDLLRYFRRRVDVQYDTTTAITTLTVEAFTAAEAKRFNEQLLELGETRVNTMNGRAQQDTIRVAQEEVDRAEEKVRRAAAGLVNYRQQQSVFDPEKQSVLQLQQVNQIQSDLTSSKTLLAQLESVAPANPQIPVLKTRIASLQGQIAEMSRGVTGNSAGSLATKSAVYERLVLDRDFADRQLASSLTSLEVARGDAMRQQLYLERVAQPNTPDKAMLPHRIRNIATTLILSLVVWGALRLLISSVREHRD